MNPEQIDPTLGLTPEKSSKPQLDPILQSISDSHSSIKSPSRVTPHTRISGVDLGTDMFGKSNLERVSEEYGGVNIISQNFEQLRAAEQPWWHQAAGFINQVAIGEIVGGTLEGIGYLGEIPKAISMLAGNEVMFGNSVSEFGKSIREWSQEATPIYQENPGTFNPGDSGWWFGNGVSIASALSLMIPSMGVTKGLSLLGSGLRGAAGLTKSARTIGNVNRALNALEGTTRSGAMFRASTTQAIFSRHMENLMEASGTFESAYQDALSKGVSEDEAKHVASEAAAKNYKLGWAMLGQDIIQYGLMAKFRMPGTMATNKLEEAIYRGMGKSKIAQFFNKNRSIGNGVTQFVSEGAEEAYQFLASEESQYAAMYEAGLIDKSTFSERMGDYAKDGEMWTSAFFGGFGGLASDIVGGRANRKALEEFQTKQVEWIRQRGATFAEMANNVAKADAAQDLDGMLKSRRNMNLEMTISSLNHGTFDFHMQQMQEMSEMSDEKLAEYNAAHPGMEITPDFRDRVLPMLIEDTKKVAKSYEDNLDNKSYARQTVGLITQLDFERDYLENSAKEYKANLSKALESTPFKVYNKIGLDINLELQALNHEREALQVTADKTKDTEVTKPFAEKRLAEIATEIEELTNELSELKLTKKDKNNIKAILDTKEVAEANYGQAARTAFANLSGEKAAHYKSQKYQEKAEYEGYKNAITALTTEQELRVLEKEINSAKLKDSQKRELRNLVEEQSKRIKTVVETVAAEKTEEEALQRTPQDVEQIDGSKSTEDGSDIDNSFLEGITPEAPTPTESTQPEVKPLPIPAGTRVVVKAGVHKGKEGLVTDKTDEAGRAYVSFNPNKPPHPYNPDNLEIVNPVITNPAKPQGKIFTPENHINSPLKKSNPNGDNINLTELEKDRVNKQIDKILETSKTVEEAQERISNIRIGGQQLVFRNNDRQYFNDYVEARINKETSISFEEFRAQNEVSESSETSREDAVPGRLGIVKPKPEYGMQGWDAWVASGAKIDEAPIRIETLSDEEIIDIGNKSDVDGKKLIELFNKFKNKESLIQEESNYLTDNYPLKFKVLDASGNPLVIDGNEVYNYLHRTYLKGTPDQVFNQRSLRGTILLGLAKNSSVKLAIHTNEGLTDKLEDAADNPTGIPENFISNLDGVRATGTDKDFLTVDQNGYYSYGKGLGVDTDVKNPPKANPGDVFVKVKTPSGHFTTVKLNRAKVSDQEAELYMDLLADAMEDAANPGAISKTRISEVPEREQQLSELIPTYKEILGANPTYAEVMDFLIYHQNSEVAARTNKNNYAPYKNDFIYMTKEGVVKYNFKQDVNGKRTVESLNTVSIRNKDARQNFKNFLMTLRHNIDLAKFKQNPAYKSYLVENKKLNTDKSTKVFKSYSKGDMYVSLVAKNFTPKKSEPSKAAPEVVQKEIASEQNKVNAKTGTGVAINEESAVVKKLQEHKNIMNSLVNKRKEDKRSEDGKNDCS